MCTQVEQGWGMDQEDERFTVETHELGWQVYDQDRQKLAITAHYSDRESAQAAADRMNVRAKNAAR